MAKLTFRTDECKGCGLCIDACPKGILRLSEETINKKGHHPAECFAPGECIGCASCAMMCPDCIITVDDDLLYDRDMIRGLWAAHLTHPDALVASRVHLMRQEGGRILPYRDWLQETGNVRGPSHALLSTNGAGSLFPPRCLPPEALDGDLAKKLCLNADDIWLKFMLLRAGTKVLWAGRRAGMPDEIRIRAEKKQALMDGNLTNDGNDGYIRAMEAYFKMNLADYC